MIKRGPPARWDDRVLQRERHGLRDSGLRVRLLPVPHARHLLHSQPHRLHLPLQEPEEDNLASTLLPGGIWLPQPDHRPASSYLPLPQAGERLHRTSYRYHLHPDHTSAVFLQDVAVYYDNDERSATGSDNLPQIRHQAQAYLHGALLLAYQHGSLLPHVHDWCW